MSSMAASPRLASRRCDPVTDSRMDEGSLRSRATITVSRRLSVGKSIADWKERAIPARLRASGVSAVMSTPSRSTVPPSGRTKPDRSSNKVVLPAPLGPMRPTTSPLETDRSTPSTAATDPYRFTSPLAASNGASPTDTGPGATPGSVGAGVAVRIGALSGTSSSGSGVGTTPWESALRPTALASRSCTRVRRATPKWAIPPGTRRIPTSHPRFNSASPHRGRSTSPGIPMR